MNVYDILELLIQIAFGATWLFFFLHAMQHVSNAHERTRWCFVFIGLNVAGVLWYIIKIYRFLPKSEKKLIKVPKGTKWRW